MHEFRYVTRKELKPIRKDVENLIHDVQDDIRDNFTFQYKFIGSVSRNMVTYDTKSNIGFDFDINIMVNDDEERYSAKEIKYILMKGFNKYVRKYNFDPCEDSTRVITIKVKDTVNSKIIHSCDFAIVNDYSDNQQKYIRFDKHGHYSWAEQPGGFYQLPDKVEFCKNNGLWQSVRDLYIQKKNKSDVPSKKSRAIFAETIHEICQQKGYYED